MTDDDDPLVRAFTVQRVEYRPQADAEIEKRLAAERCPEERLDIAHAECLTEPLGALLLGTAVDLSPAPFSELGGAIPLRTGNAEQCGGLHRSSIFGDDAAVEMTTLGGEPPADGHRLLTTERSQSHTPGMAADVRTLMCLVISLLGEPLREVSLGLSVSHKHDIDWQCHRTILSLWLL